MIDKPLIDSDEIRNLAKCLKRFGTTINPDSIQEAELTLLSLVEIATEEHKKYLIALSDMKDVCDELEQERQRAERLAEALKDAQSYVCHNYCTLNGSRSGAAETKNHNPTCRNYSELLAAHEALRKS